MPKLIDADKLKQHYAWWEGGTYTMTLDKAKNNFNVIVDVQPEAIVRCKDCKWRGELGCAVRIVDESDKPEDYDFCSWGEEKEDEEEPITPEMFAEQMRIFATDDDEEMRHISADRLMIKVLEQLGFKEGTEIFNSMGKWYC